MECIYKFGVRFGLSALQFPNLRAVVVPGGNDAARSGGEVLNGIGWAIDGAVRDLRLLRKEFGQIRKKQRGYPCLARGKEKAMRSIFSGKFRSVGIYCLILVIGGAIWLTFSVNESQARNDIPATNLTAPVQQGFEGALK